MDRGGNTFAYTSTSGTALHLVWVQREVCIQKLPGIVVRLPLVDLVGRVSNLHVHGPVSHSLVLEALGPKQNMKVTVMPWCFI